MAEAACVRLHGASAEYTRAVEVSCWHPNLPRHCDVKSLFFPQSSASRAPLVLLHPYRFPYYRQAFLQAKAAVGYPASMAWWKKGKHPNMRDINSAQEFLDAIARCGEKLILVDFYSVGCRSCKALHPKICQIAEENPEIEILTVNFHENRALCKSLGVNILPFFQFYHGREGRIDAFSCSLTKINKLRAAVSKLKDRNVALPAPGPVISATDRKEVLSITNPAFIVAASVS